MSDLLKERFEELKTRARKDGVSVELLAVGGESLSLCYQSGKMDEFESSQTRSAGIRVIDGGAQGYASTENFSPEAFRRTYAAALENARMLTDKKAEAQIPLAKSAKITDAMEDLYRPQEVPMDQKMAVARDLEALTIAADSRVHKVPYSGFTESEGWVRVMNSAGLDLTHRRTSFSGHAYALAKEGDVSKISGESFYERDFEKINVAELSAEAARRATARLGARPAKTEKMTVLWDRRVARAILQMLEESLSGESLVENTSLLKGRLNQAIASPLFNLVDDPFDRRGVGVRPFDSEGCVSQKTILIEKGELKAFLTNLEVAQRLEMPHTANASRSPGSSMSVGSSNLVVGLGASSREELLKTAPRMLLLTDLTGGLHAGYRAASGDFSLPAEGFLVENGEITGALDQFVLSGNVLELLKNVAALGDVYDQKASSLLIPDVLVSDLSVAGGA
ncbi:MAG TPA: metallopeptidase TldD-related protein [Pseudobdellovibrionaceae bacterium]|nr:metallopeptidase TldD-related protein [Pseudobdellovibrionaceae bacterium]